MSRLQSLQAITDKDGLISSYELREWFKNEILSFKKFTEYLYMNGHTILMDVYDQDDVIKFLEKIN